MLTIRPIAADELSAFLALQADPEQAADQAAYVDRMFAAGAMRPEWCYVATDGDGTVGRFAFWSLPKLDVPISLVLIDVAVPDDGTARPCHDRRRAPPTGEGRMRLPARPRSSVTSWTSRSKRRSGRTTRTSVPAGWSAPGSRSSDRPRAGRIEGPPPKVRQPPHVPNVRGGRRSRLSRRARGGLQRDA